jgi:hypothetical protein
VATLAKDENLALQDNATAAALQTLAAQWKPINVRFNKAQALAGLVTIIHRAKDFAG